MNEIDTICISIIDNLHNNDINDIKMGTNKNVLVKNLTTFLNYHKNDAPINILIENFYKNGINDNMWISEFIVDRIYKKLNGF